ncbi:Hypothetical protein HEAR1058 [Herminiimonas arsenicoxydans]|uniref:Uncharacterized protein n=1 Tax=Herminiimonas arsenicoxydans TaxID=204773 RepID=A4G400_HERAR|nr:Hypothetical protein HEAR1058 [Herminiimonas arsenicoxydans]
MPARLANTSRQLVLSYMRVSADADVYGKPVMHKPSMSFEPDAGILMPALLPAINFYASH